MVNEVEIDEKKINRLKNWIIMVENQNIRTRTNSDPEMVKIIKKRIEEEVNAPTIN